MGIRIIRTDTGPGWKQEAGSLLCAEIGGEPLAFTADF